MMSELPANVRPVPDRHGKIRYRFRRKGWKSAYLPGTPGSAEFHRAYAAIIEGGAFEVQPIKGPRKAAPRSLDDLLARHKTRLAWKKKAARTQLLQGRTLERFVDRVGKSGKRFGDRPVVDVTVAWLENILGQMSETPAAANELRKTLAGMMDYAVKMNWRPDNPVRFTEKYKEGAGHHTWTDAEIEQYRATHALGTMARLTLELALNTAARRCNVAWLTRDDIRHGRIGVAHVKGNNETSVRVMPTTQAALDALPAAPIKFLVTTVFGKPFTEAGLGQRMRKWCNEAGLPGCTIHGIRKATSRRLAETGATDAEGQAITGHKKSETFALYRAKANRSALADRAMSNLASLDVVQPIENEGETDV